MLVVPDLYVPESFERIEENEPVDLLSGAEFSPCLVQQEEELSATQAMPILKGLRLDPRLPADREFIILLQQSIVSLAEQLKQWVALLDVPPELSNTELLQWRARFDSRYCAAYHPWLKVNRIDNNGDISDEPKIINPSSVAAGIIAATELQQGISTGPANRLANAVHAIETKISDQFHDELHPLGINVFEQRRDGIWLTGARTLSRQRQWQHLSIVRLMVMLKRVLYQQMQWLVFEPNSPSLWLTVEFSLESFLGQLFRAGVFKGQSPQEAFFVRCDETLNTKRSIDEGRLIAQVGVAPAEPLEFIVLQLSRDADGTLKVVSQ